MAYEEENRVNRYLSRYRDLKAEKAPWNIHYQALAESFLTRKSNFTDTITPGAFLQEDLFDNTGQYMAHVMASAFLSMLWPDSSRSFVIDPVEEIRKESGVEEYFRFVNNKMQRIMDNPKAGLLLALQEHFLEQAVFGTSGVGALDGEDDTTPVVYEAWGIKNMCISENAQGFIDTIFSSRERTVRQVVEEYGKQDVVSPKIMEMFKAGKYEEKVEVLTIVEPRSMADRGGKEGVLGMATRTVHIDVTNKLIMRESGYREMPVFVVRFLKSIDEAYGRSPAMVALPDTVSLNALKEALIVATEKQLDPPLGVLDDGRLGGGVIDTSAGAINVFNTSGRISTEKPIFPLFTVGEFQSSKELMEQFNLAITQAFYVDRLLDLNNQTQMTAFETSVRNRMRGESLGSLFARQELECLTPLIERTFNICFRRGLLGILPTAGGVMGKVRRLWDKVLGRDSLMVPAVVMEAIEAGLDVYDIRYVSPAKRFMQSEKLQGIFTALDFIERSGAVLPGITDNIHVDNLARDVVKYSGAPSAILRTADEVAKIRADMGAQQQAATEMELMRQGSEVARNSAQAKATLAGSGSQSGGRSK